MTGEAPAMPLPAPIAPIALIAVSSLVLVLGYAAAWWPGGAPRWVAVSFALATVAQLAAFCLLGARRRDGRTGAVAPGVIAAGVLVAVAFVTAIVAPDPGAAEPLLGGLPRRTAIVLYGIGIAPLAILATVFVRTFDAWAPTDEDVARLRAIRDANPPGA